MRQDINDYVQSCNTCIRSKSRRMKPAELLLPLSAPPRPWFSIAMDFITDLPLSNNADSILVIVDRFTKMGHFVPCKKTTSTYQLATLFLENIVRLHGLLSDIISDRRPQFVSQLWSQLLSNINITRSLSSAYHPQTDGQTERLNQNLE